MFANMNDDDDDDGDVLDAWYDDNAGYDGWKHVGYKVSHNIKS